MAKNLQQVQNVLSDKISLLREEFGVQKIGIFGSFVRNEQNNLSDVDILVEFSQSPSFFKFIDLEKKLSDLVGLRVDLVTRNALKSAIKDAVLREVVYV